MAIGTGDGKYYETEFELQTQHFDQLAGDVVPLNILPPAANDNKQDMEQARRQFNLPDTKIKQFRRPFNKLGEVISDEQPDEVKAGQQFAANPDTEFPDLSPRKRGAEPTAPAAQEEPRRYRGGQVPWDFYPPPKMDPHGNPMDSGEDVSSDPPRGLTPPTNPKNLQDYHNWRHPSFRLDDKRTMSDETPDEIKAGQQYAAGEPPVDMFGKINRADANNVVPFKLGPKTLSITNPKGPGRIIPLPPANKEIAATLKKADDLMAKHGTVKEARERLEQIPSTTPSRYQQMVDKVKGFFKEKTIPAEDKQKFWADVKLENEQSLVRALKKMEDATQAGALEGRIKGNVENMIQDLGKWKDYSKQSPEVQKGMRDRAFDIAQQHGLIDKEGNLTDLYLNKVVETPYDKAVAEQNKSPLDKWYDRTIQAGKNRQKREQGADILPFKPKDK